MSIQQTTARRTWLLAGLLLVSSPCAAADVFDALAQAVSEAARREGVARLAVAGLAPTPGSGGGAADWIAEELTTSLARRGGVRVVERRLLGRLLEEHRLESTGLVEDGGRKRLGRIHSVDAIVAGSYTVVGGLIELNVRLIDVETGLVLFADRRRTSVDRPEPRSEVLSPAEASPIRTAPKLRDALSAPRTAADAEPDGDRCAGARERAQTLERSITEEKARYWALKLRQTILSADDVRFKPGAVIPDPDGRRRFLERFRFWVSQPEVPPLTQDEGSRMVLRDRAAYSLVYECRLR